VKKSVESICDKNNLIYTSYNKFSNDAKFEGKTGTITI